MNDNHLHAGALAMFVALCIGAAIQGVREPSTHAAAARAAAAEQVIRSSSAARPVALRSGIDRTSAIQ